MQVASCEWLQVGVPEGDGFSQVKQSKGMGMGTNEEQSWDVAECEPTGVGSAVHLLQSGASLLKQCGA